MNPIAEASLQQALVLFREVLADMPLFELEVGIQLVEQAIRIEEGVVL